MKKEEILNRYKEDEVKLKINLKNGSFLTGYVISIEDETVFFKDKFGNEVMVDFEAISHVIPVGRSG